MASDYLDKLDAIFQEHSDMSNALAMSKYMKGKFAYYGLKSPLRRSLQSAFIKENGLPRTLDFRAVSSEAMNWNEREMNYVGMELVFRFKKHYTENDHAFISDLITTRSWWDTVDFIASNIAGHYFQIHPNMTSKIIPMWRDSSDMWLNRTAILFQLKYKDKTDFELLKNVIKPHLQSKEFFHQKAIGWALRQHAKFRPEEVLKYVAKTDLRPLSRREALKHFPDHS